MLIQQTFELYVKALLGLKNIPIFKKKYRIHNLICLMEEAKIYYPELEEILRNQSAYHLLEELGNEFDTIRYCEGCLCFSDISRLIKIIEFIKNKLENLINKEANKNE